jgi:hypothetical protein
MNNFQSFVSEVPSAITTERRHRLIVTTNKDWRNKELLAPMKALAEKHSLEYEYSFYDSDQCLNVEIHGEGFHITAKDCERDTIEDINIDFYLDYHKSPTAQSQEKLDILLDELRELFGDSENAIVNEEP